MRFSWLPVFAAVFLTACAQQSVMTANYGGSDLFSGDPSVGTFGGAGGQSRSALTTCIYSKNAVSQGVPSLASRILRKASGADAKLTIGLEDVLAYTNDVVSASGGDNIAAAEVISRHEASDSSCFRQQASYWRGQSGSKDAAKNAKAISHANGAFGQAYSMLKTHTAVGDAQDLSERLSRSYIPVGMHLPGAVL